MKIRIKNTPHMKTRGFTLVELAIVLVIIGLIIGGVLTGQQVIQNARVTKTLNDIQGYESQFQTYQQNYNAVAGDDANAATRFPNAPGVANGAGTGTLAGAFDATCPTAAATATTTETCLVWADLIAAGLVKSQISPASQPSNPFGGVYGFQNGGLGAFTTTVLCLNNVPGSAALAIDTRLDDGNPAAGTVQSFVTPTTGGAAGPAVASYSSALNYTMCIKL